MSAQWSQVMYYLGQGTGASSVSTVQSEREAVHILELRFMIFVVLNFVSYICIAFLSQHFTKKKRELSSPIHLPHISLNFKSEWKYFALCELMGRPRVLFHCH